MNCVLLVQATRTTRSLGPHGAMSCVDDPHGAFSWADGPLGSSSPSFFACDLVASAHRRSPFALLSPLPVCDHAACDSRVALSPRELMERCEAEGHDTWQQRVAHQRRWNAAAAQPNHSAALPMRASRNSAWVRASPAAAAASLTQSQPWLRAAEAAAERWSGNEPAGSEAHAAAIPPMSSPSSGPCSSSLARTSRVAAGACREREERLPSCRRGAAAARATGGVHGCSAASRAAAAAASAGGRQSASGCSAVEREGARRTPSERCKLRRSQTAGAAELAGAGGETPGSAGVGAWPALCGPRGNPASVALTSPPRPLSCAPAAAAPAEIGEGDAEGWMWEYQGCCEHRSWNFSNAAYSPQTHLNVPHSTARTSSSSFFSPSHHTLTPAHDLLPRTAYVPLSLIDTCCGAAGTGAVMRADSLAPCSATGAAVCLPTVWPPWEATPPAMPTPPAPPPIPVAPPSTAPPPPPTPRPAQLQQAFPCAAGKGAASTGGGTGRWWGRLTRLWRRTDRRRPASRSCALPVLLPCCVLSAP
ncbi:unnamed protein product [Closterium sp. Yama58-4]|nr:unnamed protein product [Closterium sp. Yama58-4]